MRVAVVALLIPILAACASPGPGETTSAAAVEGGTMELTSPSFEPGGAIPGIFTCDGDDVSPELDISGIPTGTITLVLVMDDPDAPGGTWDHWVVYDVPPRSTIPEDVESPGVGGNNSWNRTGYGGPCPPSGTHRYFFRILALDEMLGLPAGADKATVLAAAQGHVLAEATLMGTYAR
jgi:Raf kinase inhibitor-like YbhB/YbcL family protein